MDLCPRRKAEFHLQISGFVLYSSGLKPLNMKIFLASCSDLYFSGNTSHKLHQFITKTHGGKTSLCSCCGESYKIILVQNPVSGTACFVCFGFVMCFLGAVSLRQLDRN